MNVTALILMMIERL